ncbi:MAG TPA: hypothetical protein VJ044_00190 [Candidatus Hodarchaeales archaeon]|nr:hypothetical protein [Candidatus Hodarchaeales archaeon]
MIVYPFSAPIILTDDVYVSYGGHTGTSTANQRQAAYLIAEMQATDEVGSFLLPVTVTGTFGWPMYPDHLVLPYAYVHSIKGVTVLDQQAYDSCDLDESSGCAFIWNDTYGYIDPRRVSSVCGCAYGAPYQLRIAWESGLPTGTASKANVLLALTMVAEINLNEIVDPSANEGVGDIGIQEFSNMQYREKRKTLKNTAFGNSARANKAAQLLRGLKRFRALKL